MTNYPKQNLYRQDPKQGPYRAYRWGYVLGKNLHPGFLSVGFYHRSCHTLTAFQSFEAMDEMKCVSCNVIVWPDDEEDVQIVYRHLEEEE